MAAIDSGRVVTFGEIMLRLSTPGFSRFLQASQFDVTYGGGEANVASSLAQFGLDASFVSKLPKHEIGQAAVNHLRRFGVDTSFVVRGGERVGVYFLETGASQRASKVVYDRAGAAVASLGVDELDVDAVFAGASWFHWTGITPALGEVPRETLGVLLAAAKRVGCTVSCDLNFRKKLWTTAEAQVVMRPLMEHVDVCIANEEDAEKSLGVSPEDTDVTAGYLDEAGYGKLARKLREQFGFKAVAITLRESHSASRNGWSALMLDDRECSTATRSRAYDVQLVDRVGGGDSFAAGLIYGLTRLGDTRKALEFAVAASCLKQTIPGDFNIVSVDEVLKLAEGDASGRVDR
ncbi:MAG: sugar kinase [Phycisphaeraceae bacterium]